MMLDGELVATLQGNDLPKDPRVAYPVPDTTRASCRSTNCSTTPPRTSDAPARNLP